VAALLPHEGLLPVWFCRLRCHVVVKMGPTSFGEDHSKKKSNRFLLPCGCLPNPEGKLTLALHLRLLFLGAHGA